MTHDAACIEIAPDGLVTSGGNVVGTIAFAGRDGILGRIYGVGVHTLHGEGEALADDFFGAGMEPDEDVIRIKTAVKNAIRSLSMKEPNITSAIKSLRGALA